MTRIILVMALILTGCASQQTTIKWRRVIVQNAELGWLSTDDSLEIETDGFGRYCLRERASNAPTHLSDCVARGSLEVVKRAADLRLQRCAPGCTQYPWWDKDHPGECLCTK